MCMQPSSPARCTPVACSMYARRLVGVRSSPEWATMAPCTCSCDGRLCVAMAAATNGFAPVSWNLRGRDEWAVRCGVAGGGAVKADEVSACVERELLRAVGVGGCKATAGDDEGEQAHSGCPEAMKCVVIGEHDEKDYEREGPGRGATARSTTKPPANRWACGRDGFRE